MIIEENHAYVHGTDAVFALFTDRHEIEAKQEALGARNIRIVRCERNAEGASVRFVRDLPAEVPGMLKRFLQPWNSVTQSERWRFCQGGEFNSDITIDIANVPVTVGGTLRLMPVDTGCVNQIRFVIECGIPFIGKTLAEFVAMDCKRIMAAEYDYIVRRLASV